VLTMTDFYYNIVRSSKTWYGFANQLKWQLSTINGRYSDDGISFCYIVDVGPYNPNTGLLCTPDTWPPLKDAIDTINSDVDLIFYATKWFSKFVHDKPNAFYLPHFANTNIYFPFSTDERTIDVGMVCKATHQKRKNFLEFCRKTDKFKLIRRQGIYFNEQADFYRKCKIVISDADFKEVGTRLFEATACGCLMINERVDGIDDLFVEDKEIVLFDTLPEMSNKVLYYLNHPEKALPIAVAGMNRTHREHSLRLRADFIKNKILEFSNHGKTDIPQSSTG
jgi:glycosyltransferase involved in cell wall biosynthesis